MQLRTARGRLACAAALLCAAALRAAVAQTGAAELSRAHAKLRVALEAAPGRVPSWWECGRCQLCAFDADDAPPPPPELHDAIADCPLCTGCTHHLELLSTRARHAGNTGASVFDATDARGANSVLKLHGVVTPMVSPAKLAQMQRLFGQRRYRGSEVLKARALTPLADACGLGHVATREWVAPLRAVLPGGSGEKVAERAAVFAERAPGVALELCTTRMPPDALAALLASVPHAAVRDAALYDLLFRQGDRHAENVFVADDGAMTLIDSRDAALDVGLDSLFFASAATNERNRVGNARMFNASAPATTHHLQQTTLDYRCHVAGGEIGTQLPPRVRQCVARWAAMDADDVATQATLFPLTFEDQEALGDKEAARTLKLRSVLVRRLVAQAKLLHEHGFEGALARTNHKNESGVVPFSSGFPVGPPCCAVERVAAAAYACAPHGHVTLAADATYPPAPTQPPPRAAAAAATNAGATTASAAAADDAAYPQRAAANRAAWLARLGNDARAHAIVSAGGDIFDAVPASGFDPALRNPCWRNASGTFCLPYFHVIGVSKCGTTDLYRRLKLHADVARSHNKGPHFWDERHDADWYLRIYDAAVPAILRSPARAIVGDASSGTLTFSGVGVRAQRRANATLAEVMAALQPDLRLIALLRDPVERLYSSYFYYGIAKKGKFGASADGFHAFAEEQVAAHAAACAALPVAADAAAQRRSCAVAAYGSAQQLVKGIYAAFLPDWFAAFKRQQVLVLRSEAYSADVAGGLRAALAHLGLEAPPPRTWARMAAGKRSNTREANGAARGAGAGAMRDDTRAMLRAFYAPHNAALAALLGDERYLEWNGEAAAATSSTTVAASSSSMTS